MHGKSPITRRRFVHSSLLGAALAVAPGCLAGMRDPGEKVRFRARFKSAGTPGPEPLPPTRIYPAMPPATVAVADAGKSIMEAVREAVQAAGGIDEIEKGQRVVIKPNMCGPSIKGTMPGRITTNPEVLRAVIKLVKERGATPIVGDRSMMMTELAFKTTGFKKICREEGAVPFPWTRAEYVRFRPNGRHWSDGFRIPKILAEADHFINVPQLKNHQASAAEFTCCLKAFVGVCLPLDRWQEGTNALHTANISEKIAELNLSARPLINIVDATDIMVCGGPDGAHDNRLWVSPNLVIASKDRVACDSVALATLKRFGAENKVELPYVSKSVWDQVQIYYAAQIGIGQADPAMITVEDVSAPLFDEIKSNWV